MSSSHLAITLLSLIAGPRGLERWRPPELEVARPPPIVNAEALLSIASSYIGRPYRMGGVGSPGLDCSGFTCRVYAQAGYAIPRVSRDQARVGRPVPLRELAPGDLLFFAASPGAQRINHVGIYLGEGQMVHASSGSGQVVVSDLSQRYYRSRLVGARRHLPDPGTQTSSAAWAAKLPTKEAPTYELEEHAGEDALLPTLRVPARLPPPVFGARTFHPESGYLGLRALVASEEGEPGFVLAPELGLTFREIALSIIFAVPIRFPFDGAPTVGTIERASDVLRFLRQLELGLPGADLEARLSREGDETLGAGLVLERFVPSLGASGLPGFSVLRTPLSLFTGLRTELFGLEGFIDDVVSPGVMGVGGFVPVLLPGWKLGLELVTDDRGQDRDRVRRTLWAGALSLQAGLVESRRWSFSSRLGLAANRALGAQGVGAELGLSVQHRFGAGDAYAVTLSTTGAWLGRRHLARLFGPTYLAARALHTESLPEVGGRLGLGGELQLRLGRFQAAIGYDDAFGDGRHRLDRRLFASLELRDVGLGHARWLDLRAGWAGRGLLDPGLGSADVLFAGARLRFWSWLAAEAYLQESDGFEAGLGLQVAFLP